MRRIVFFLALVEVSSGIIQGYYTPLYTDIARHLGIRDADVNWLEALQLVVSAVAVPALAKLGDLWGHQRILLLSAVVTALAAWAVALAPGFPVFLLAWSLMGFYTVWLPLEIALIHGAARADASRAAGSTATDDGGPVPGDAGRATRRAAGILVAALEFGVIGGALAGGALGETWAGFLPGVLAVPAVALTLCCVAIAFGVPRSVPELTAGKSLDLPGLAWLAAFLVLLMGGLSLMRLNGPLDPLGWAAVMFGLLLLWPFARQERKAGEPLVDLRVVTDRALWPVFVTAGLFGVSVLGAQAPLSTFARTDPAAQGYGLGLSTSQVSLVIGVYVLTLLLGALLFPVACRWIAPRRVLQGAAVLVGCGYLLFLPWHGSLTQVLVNMAIAGLGSGALVAALPAAAASAAPQGRTGMATGLTNATKTVGGAIASAVFGIALLHGAGQVASTTTAAPLAGYLTVWALCGATALVAALLLQGVPKDAFTH